MVSDDDGGMQSVMPITIAESPKKRQRTFGKNQIGSQKMIASDPSSSLISGSTNALQQEIVEHGPPVWASRILDIVQSPRYDRTALRCPRIGSI